MRLIASRHRVAGSALCDRYSPVSVLTRTLSPVFTNGGTWTTRPVSRRAGLTCALAVAPLMPGAVSSTLRSTVERQLDADRLRAVELDVDDRVGHDVVHRVAERLFGDVQLLVRCRCP